MQDMDDFAKKYPQYAHLLPVRKNIYKLDRLEGLHYTVTLQQLEIGAKNNTEITKHLLKQARRNVNAVQEIMGFGKNFYAINSDIVKSFVNVAWCSGGNFSNRIWADCNKLANYLNTDIAQGFARGDNSRKLVKQVCERFKHVTRNDAYRLIYTEGTYVMAESSIKQFEADYEQYKISTVSDGKVCKLCSDMSQHVFYIKDRVPGRNFPPFHPWCRCTYEIVIDDWDKWIDDYIERHRANPPEEMLKIFSKHGTMKTADNKEVKNVHYIGKINKNIYRCVTDDIITDEIVITEKQIEHIKLRHPNDYERFNQYFAEIVSKPDYIIEANKPNSALVLKELKTNQEQFKTVVRIATSNDNPDYKNSIITFMKIDDREWNRLINNKNILYKSE